MFNAFCLCQTVTTENDILVFSLITFDPFARAPSNRKQNPEVLSVANLWIKVSLEPRAE